MQLVDVLGKTRQDFGIEACAGKNEERRGSRVPDLQV